MSDPNEDGYAPFPELQLMRMADVRERLSGESCSAELKALFERDARACRDAIACHAALRERCLLAELELGQLRHEILTRQANATHHAA